MHRPAGGKTGSSGPCAIPGCGGCEASCLHFHTKRWNENVAGGRSAESFFVHARGRKRPLNYWRRKRVWLWNYPQKQLTPACIPWYEPLIMNFQKNIFSRFSTLLIFILIPVLLSPCVSFSHPHVFVVTRLVAVFDGKGLAGIRVRWNFDEMFSSMIAGDYDQNQNGILEEAEISKIREEAFSYLANYDYFCFAKIDGKAFKVKYTKDFKAVLNDGKLSYEFFIPCHVAASKKSKTFTMAVYDPTYYSAVFFAENQPVSTEGGTDFEISTLLDENKEESYYYDMLHPWELKLRFALKNA